MLAYNPYTKKQTEENISLPVLEDIINCADIIARTTVEEYMVFAETVISTARRRTLLSKLRECEQHCVVGDEQELEQKIYKTLDDVMLDFSLSSDAPQFKDEVDNLWQNTLEKQKGNTGLTFKFPTLNEYATIDRTELFIFAAEQKQGKSIMLLNCAVDLLRKNQSVLYIDSELSSQSFLCRLISHLTGIECRRIRKGKYDTEEEKRIQQAIEWMKTRKFTHKYMPTFDPQSVYMLTKKVKHTQGLDVLIVDYFKGGNDGDAFDIYRDLGKMVDMVKNQIAGEMNIATIGAAQATSTGKLADSAKIARNASTVALILNKTQEEMERDGKECGNKKLKIVFNRNGDQMTLEDEYIDLWFNGSLVDYKEAVQHKRELPY